MSTDCVIIFDHPDVVYNSGNTLNGYVKLQTQKTKSIRGISIKILGYGKFFWTEGTSNSAKHFKSYEQYLNSVTYVLGSEDGNCFDFPPGIYEYTFSCELPIELPTYLIGDYCKIKYKAIVTVERRLRFDNIFQKDFMVNHISNLNLMDINRLPRKNMSRMQLAPIHRLCWSDKGDIKAELEIHSDGYVPGQQIPFKLVVYNDSNYDIREPEIKLLKCYILESTEPHVKVREFQKVIIIKRLNVIPRHTNKEFKETFYVPFVPPSQRTRFMQIEYKIAVRIFAGYIKQFYVDVPVTIGTIPLPDFDPNKPISNCPMPLHIDDDI